MDVSERVARLEAECRDLRRSATRSRWITSLVVATSIVLTASAELIAQPDPNAIAPVVRARRFEVVGGENDGMAVAYMTATAEGHGMIELTTSDGHPSVSMRTTPSGQGTLRTLNKTGFPLFVAEPTSDGTAFISVQNGRGREIAALYGNDGGGVMSVFNSKGYPLVTADAAKMGGRFKVFAGEGRPVIIAAASALGAGELRMLNADNFIASELVAVQSGEGRLSLFAQDAPSYSVPEWLANAEPLPGACGVSEKIETQIKQ